MTSVSKIVYIDELNDILLMHNKRGVRIDKGGRKFVKT